MAMPDRDCYSEDDGVSLSLNKTNQCLEDLLKSLIFHGTEVDNDGSKVIRILISIVYSVVCAMGLIGNLLVLYLLQANKKKSTMTILVMGLAVTDIQFVLTLPFWAVDTAMDFSWPFGRVMCKVVSSVTVMSMYASVFFLAVMSITRYCSVSQSLKMRRRSSTYWDRLTCIFIWGLACVATLPQATYSTTIVLPTEELCITKFPEVHSNPQFWFGVYQALKVLVGFILPLAIISASYLLLLRFVNSKEMSSNNPKRTSRVTKSVTIVVLAFFISWLPNQAITLWSAFIKLNVVHFSVAFYNTQAYIFPVTVCLAHSNSCLNPVLYCLIRREFRVAVRDLVLKVTRVRRIRASQSSGPPGKKRQLPVTISMTRAVPPVESKEDQISGGLSPKNQVMNQAYEILQHPESNIYPLRQLQQLLQTYNLYHQGQGQQLHGNTITGLAQQASQLPKRNPNENSRKQVIETPVNPSRSIIDIS